MNDKAANIICAVVAGAATVYLGWHICQARTVKAVPVAGVIKHLSEEQAAANLEPPVAGWQKYSIEVIEDSEENKPKAKKKAYIYSSRQTLNSYDGVYYGPSGKESYYNMDMSHVVELMQAAGYDLKYWVRKDGVKMFGNYVMVAADLSIRPKGTILQTSFGPAIVCDTGTFARYDSSALDVAVAW